MHSFFSSLLTQHSKLRLTNGNLRGNMGCKIKPIDGTWRCAVADWKGLENRKARAATINTTRSQKIPKVLAIRTKNKGVKEFAERQLQKGKTSG